MAQKLKISLVIPCYNEEGVIDLCHSAVNNAIKNRPETYEIIYINDGSTDNTLLELKGIQKDDPRVHLIDLSRNFGKEAALSAGLKYASGDAAIILDADLQDPPALIGDFIDAWKESTADMVYGQRITRAGESITKKATASAFYKIINKVTKKFEIPVNTGDFRLVNRQVLDALNGLNEHHRFMKGLFAWVGYKQVALPYHREARVAGQTKWNYLSLWNFSLDGITSFSMVPLKIATFMGVIISIFSFLFGGYILINTLLNGNDVPGYPSLVVMISFLSGIQLLTIGILGEYIGRIFNETKNRPTYLIKNTYTPNTQKKKK